MPSRTVPAGVPRRRAAGILPAGVLVGVCLTAVTATSHTAAEHAAGRPDGIVLVVQERAPVENGRALLAAGLQRLATAGVRFDDVVAATACVEESLQVLSTGRWPGAALASATELETMLAAAGWSTARPRADGAAAALETLVAGEEPFLLRVDLEHAAGAGLPLDGLLLEMDRVLVASGRLADVAVVVTAATGFDAVGQEAQANDGAGFDGLVVPLVLRWPAGLPAGVRIDAPVSLVDLAPTLAALAAVEPSGHDGQSLLPLVRAPEAPSSRGYQERPAFAVVGAARERALVVAGGWRLLAASGPTGLRIEALFDHVRDRAGERDLAARHAPVATRLAGRLERWLAAVNGDVSPAS